MLTGPITTELCTDEQGSNKYIIMCTGLYPDPIFSVKFEGVSYKVNKIVLKAKRYLIKIQLLTDVQLFSVSKHPVNKTFFCIN